MKSLMFIPICLLSISLVACGILDSGDSQAVNSNGGNTSNQEESTFEAEIIKEEAAYVGQPDANSIEVNTEIETLSIQVGKVEVDWSNVEKNTPLTIEYYQNDNGQLVLNNVVINEIEIGKSEETFKVVKAEGSFVREIDTNTVEVLTEFETLVLQTSEVKGVNWSTMAQHTKVNIEYYKNDKGQNILTSIEIY